MTYSKVLRSFTTTYTYTPGENIVRYTRTWNKSGAVQTGYKGEFETDQDAQDYFDDL